MSSPSATSEAATPSTPAPPAKPHLRGWLHAGMVPLVVLADLVLLVLGPHWLDRLGVAVYMIAGLLLFGTSATYHRFTWGERGSAVLRRWDHSNIFVFIAGTYTPLALMLLRGWPLALLLGIVWGGAVLGLAFRILWLSAPRWLYVALYVALGWAALAWLPAFWHEGGPAVVVLLALGGLAYSVGAFVYARKWPDPSPVWFGFHEIFHACTVLAFLCHWTAILLAMLAA